MKQGPLKRGRRGSASAAPLRGSAQRFGGGSHQPGFFVELLGARMERDAGALDGVFLGDQLALGVAVVQHLARSDERRVGKESGSTCSYRCGPYHLKKIINTITI